MKKNYVYLGPANLANCCKQIEKSLKRVGIKADFITWSNAVHEFGYERTKVFHLFNKPPFRIFGKNIFFFINEYFLKPVYFICALIKYDTFIFIKPSTFLRNNFDLKVLKLFKRKIAFIFAGCCDRDPNYEDDPEYVCNVCDDNNKQKNCLCDCLEKKEKEAHYFEKYADHIFGPDDTVSYIKDKSKIHRFVAGFEGPIINCYDKHKNNKKVRIAHLPSNPKVKGTDIIEAVLAKIKKEENVDIVIKRETWPREKIINELYQCDILIDSLLRYTFGTLSIEGIQYGCVVLNSYPDWIAQYYDISPVVQVTKETLYNTLKELIQTREKRLKCAKRSQEAFRKYFTYDVVGNYYKEKLGLK